jgi:hypothetical protein
MASRGKRALGRWTTASLVRAEGPTTSIIWFLPASNATAASKTVLRGNFELIRRIKISNLVGKIQLEQMVTLEREIANTDAKIATWFSNFTVSRLKSEEP